MALTKGTRLGAYEILDAIGAGGMGEVYQAHDTKLGRDVALKVLPALVADDPERLARFRREAQVLASLNHPHIAQIYGFEDSHSTPSTGSGQAGSGQAGATHALVMELVSGPTLADRIAQGPVPLAESLAIARQIGEALEAAHEKGIVHRDLKPANVKIREDGAVKVLDFGLAKALAPDGSGAGADATNSPTLTARSTQLGMILGTAAYMAPEQAKGRSVDKRADIWAFGVVLFEMISGQRAFKGDDISDVLAAVLRQEIDWAALPKDTPKKVRRLLERCLERDPKRRLRDIGDAFLELDTPDEPAAAFVPAATPPRSSAASRWLPWLAGGLIAAAGVTWALIRTPSLPPRIVTRSQFSTKDFSAFVNVSRDGTRLAYAVAGGANSASLVLRSMDQFEGKPIPGGEGGAFPIFSPDGQWIVYMTLESPSKIRKIPVTGGTSITVCDGSLFAGGAWGDDDTIVFPGPKGLLRVPAAGGTPEALTTLDAAKAETAHVRPQFLPGGAQLLFTIRTATTSNFAVLDLKKGGYRAIAKGGDNGRFVASGHLTYVRSGTLFALPFDLGRLAVTGGEVPVVEGVSTTGPEGTADYSVSDAGLLVYSSESASQGTTLGWVDRKGGTKALPGQSRQLWGTGRLSLDGRRVANGIHTDKGTDIWVLDVERGTPTRLTFDGSGDLPIWAPDGRHVIYAGALAGKPGLFAVATDGSGKPELVVATSAPATPSSFTPDGKTLLFDQPGSDRPRQIFVVALPDGGKTAEPHPLHPAAAAEANGQISPDGKWVAYESAESGRREVYLQPFPGPGAKVRVSTDGGYNARWARDGRELYFWANQPNSRFQVVDVHDGTTGPPQDLFQVVSGTTWDTTPTHDRFLIELTINSSGAGSTIATVTDWFEELRRRAPIKK